MKKQYKFPKVSIIATIVVTILIGIISCEDEDYRIIPEPESAPTITGIEPMSSDIGSEVVINGTNFSRVPTNNKVSFSSGILARVSMATDTTLTVTVPEGATTGPISIKKGQINVEGPVFNVVGAPQITDLNVTGAAVGETIIITGNNFNTTAGENIVSFNGTIAEITAASETQLTVIVPNDATTGPLTVEAFGQIGTVDIFTITPIIVSFEPTSGVANDEITISGTNFSLISKNNNVSFNGVLASILSVTTTELVVVVPAEATSGKIALEIENLLAVSATDFTTIPSIVSFTPEAGAPGAEVIITGANFSLTPSENSINFNGVPAIVTESTATSITTSVPDGSDSGPITVEVNGQLGTSANDFMVDNSIVSLAVSVNEVNDDVEEAADGRMTLDSSDLELGEFDTSGTPDLGLQKIGLRFNNVTIPAGVTILEANIVFVADGTAGADPTEMTISGENIGNAAAYTEDVGNLSARSLTTANEIWNIPEWIGSDTPIADRTTVDISSILNEIISRGDWSEGNSMNFIFEATGVSAGATTNNVGREAETFDVDNPEEGAQLIISYMIN